jgi:phage terminase large subunit-like protein
MLSKSEQVRILRRMAELKPNPLLSMPHRHARAAQLPPPGDWYAWFLMAGRGFGKTRTGAEWIKDRMMAEPGHRVAIIAPDFAVGRDVCIEGESGLFGIEPNPGLFPRDIRRGLKWNRSIGELVLPNGSMLKIFGADKRKDAESLRGYQAHTAWFEELGTQTRRRSARRSHRYAAAHQVDQTVGRGLRRRDDHRHHLRQRRQPAGQDA